MGKHFRRYLYMFDNSFIVARRNINALAVKGVVNAESDRLFEQFERVHHTIYILV